MTRKNEIITHLKALRDTIIQSFETFEESHKFKRSHWEHLSGGGGEISLIRGDVFEKAAVNWSAVSGDKFPMNDGEGAFFATGVSLITHMKNPFAPTVHMNVRYIETEKQAWFGGGYDLTPMGFPFEEDTLHFHEIAKTTLDRFDKTLYPKWKEEAAKYFYIPHRKKERGVGGLFFDHFRADDPKHFEIWKAVGLSFIETCLPIYKRRIFMPFGEAEKALQQKLRAHYVEFNLLYDRGTKFGFLSGGNPEAILCSMPPNASW
jgi:coproporphyrinogen III oxidase